MTESESICNECGHPTEWAQDIGSAVCTECGTLADPSQQSALTSAQESFPRDVPSYAPPTTLKSIRRNAAWDLPGQSSRNDRNKVLSLSLPFFPILKSSRSQLTIHNLICTLSDRLGYHGVPTRAQAIFDSIMQRTSIKWGKAAKLAAAAAVVFAMREQGRGDRTHYVAVSTSFPHFQLELAWPPWPDSVLSHPGLMHYSYGCGLLGFSACIFSGPQNRAKRYCFLSLY
jgi:transcription factor IIIB 90 kDa subunit